MNEKKITEILDKIWEMSKPANELPKSWLVVTALDVTTLLNNELKDQ